jgi:hypothetical protein
MLPELEVVFGRGNRLGQTTSYSIDTCGSGKSGNDSSEDTKIHITNRRGSPQSFAMSSFPIGQTSLLLFYRAGKLKASKPNFQYIVLVSIISVSG